MLKRTPLFEVYKDYEGAKLIDFGGWELPVNFASGIIAEHMAVRENAGLFDVSHMGEIIVEGKNSEAFLDWLLPNNITGMEEYQCLYSPMCYPDGGVVDDLLVYKYNNSKYLLVVNASNVDKDYKWITEDNDWVKNNNDLPGIENKSKKISSVALQGPKSTEYLAAMAGNEINNIKFFYFRDDLKINGIKCIISRTGYTGEVGYEIYVDNKDAVSLWSYILETTKNNGVLPIGLGARDTLRFESKLPLYGHELTKDITPLEANLGFFIDLEKDDFCGKDALVKQKQNGIPRSLRGCEMVDKGIPREGYRVFLEGNDVGYVTSGTKSPMLNKFCGLVLIKRDLGLKLGDEIQIEIKGKLKIAKLVKTPFYKNI